MIDMSYGVYRLICDICGEEVNEKFTELQDAVNYRKGSDWKSQKRNGEWLDVCPDCIDS